MAIPAPRPPHLPQTGQSSGSGPAPPGVARPGDLPPVHGMLICVDLPCLAISPEHGQLTGTGLEGVYQSGRRLLSRCQLRVAGREPVAVQGRLVSAHRARFISVVRTPADTGPDPKVGVERSRDADGTERITLRSSAERPLRLPVEIALGTDLAGLGTVAAGRSGPELRASVHDWGIRWSAGRGAHVVVTADPPPKDALASAGMLRWEVELAPGASRTIELRVRSDRPARSSGRTCSHTLPEARAEGDDPRLQALLRVGLADLRALLLRDPGGSADAYLAAGVPWRCGPAPAEALWAARMALPLSTRLASATLRTFARTQLLGSGRDFGRIPGPMRDAGPHLPPSCTGVEATLAFPVVLAEAWRWGLPEQELAGLLPMAERCLHWLCQAAGDGGILPEPGPSGVRRAETQAHAHRAALLGADLLEACGRPGADAWREWASELRHRFQEDFWMDGGAGGRPAAGLLADGRPVPYLGGGAAHLLDTGLLGGGRYAPGLLDRAQTGQLARLLGSPALDSGWGLRSLGTTEPGHNPFGHRAGAVRVHETVVAVAGWPPPGTRTRRCHCCVGSSTQQRSSGTGCPRCTRGSSARRKAFRCPIRPPAARRPWPRPQGSSF